MWKEPHAVTGNMTTTRGEVAAVQRAGVPSLPWFNSRFNNARTQHGWCHRELDDSLVVGQSRACNAVAA